MGRDQLTTVPAPRDLLAKPRKWYDEKSVKRAAEAGDLGSAMVDLSKLSLAYLAKALLSPKTSPEDKLKIGLAFAPRITIERRGRPRKVVAGETAGDEDLVPLLAGYGVTARTGG